MGLALLTPQESVFQEIWKSHIFRKFRHFLEYTIQFLMHFCFTYTIPHIQLFSVLILT